MPLHHLQALIIKRVTMKKDSQIISAWVAGMMVKGTNNRECLKIDFRLVRNQKCINSIMITTFNGS